MRLERGGGRGDGGGWAGACKGRVEQVVVSHLLHTNRPGRNCGQIKVSTVNRNVS